MIPVSEQIKDQVLTVTLNRPENRNALDQDVLAGLSHAVDRAAEVSDIKVIVICGGEQRFCSGLNLKVVSDLDEQGKGEFLDKVEHTFRRIYHSPKPVIAMIDGPALAGGFDLAVMCDIRYASDRALFGQPEVLLGFTQLIDPLWKIIGLGRARELAMTGRTYDAFEAEKMGLVSKVYSPRQLEPAVMKIARDLAGRDPEALAATRKMCREIPGLPADEALAEQVDVFRRVYSRSENTDRIHSLLAGLKNKDSQT